jgi:hypothetical protein
VSPNACVRDALWTTCGSKDDELARECITAIAVDSVRRISVDGGSGSITYLEGDDEVTICIEPEVAAAAIRARID